MPAVVETVEQVRLIEVDQYKYGFVTDIESEKAPKGLSEDIVRFISAKKSEPEWMLAWRLDAYRRWLTMSEPNWARVDYPPIDYQDLYYYAAPKTKAAPKSLDEIDPEILKTYEKLGIPLREQEMLAGVVRKDGASRVAVDAVFELGFRRHDIQGGAGPRRRDLLPDLRGVTDAPGTGEEISRHRGAGQRQFLRHVELRSVLGWIVRLRAGGRAMPNGAINLFPDPRCAFPSRAPALEAGSRARWPVAALRPVETRPNG